MRTNLRVFRLHEALAGSLPWLPMLVFFTAGGFGIDGALTLSSIFYLAVVLAEVPSGWMSDRLGRVITLRVTAVMWLLAHTAFLVAGDSFAVVAVAEVFLAVGFAALSGTNVAFHYDSLEALDLTEEFEARQAKISALIYVSLATSAVAGGLLAYFDLRLAFVLSLVLSAGQLFTTLGMTEPPHASDGPAEAFGAQLRSCASYLTAPFLRWVLGYWIAMVVLEHVAFTLAQPYLTEVLGRAEDALGTAPIWSGLLYAGFSIVGAMAARVSSGLRVRVGLFAALMGVSVLSASIISLMAITVSAVVVVVMLFRSVQAAVSGVLLSAAVAPLIEQRHRATYLSLNSLAGRMTYGMLLFAVARAAGDDLGLSLSLLALVSWLLVFAVAGGIWALGAARPDLRESRT